MSTILYCFVGYVDLHKKSNIFIFIYIYTCNMFKFIYILYVYEYLLFNISMCKYLKINFHNTILYIYTWLLRVIKAILPIRFNQMPLKPSVFWKIIYLSKQPSRIIIFYKQTFSFGLLLDLDCIIAIGNNK